MNKNTPFGYMLETMDFIDASMRKHHLKKEEEKKVAEIKMEVCDKCNVKTTKFVASFDGDAVFCEDCNDKLVATYAD